MNPLPVLLSRVAPTRHTGALRSLRRLDPDRSFPTASGSPGTSWSDKRSDSGPPKNHLPMRFSRQITTINKGEKFQRGTQTQDTETKNSPGQLTMTLWKTNNEDWLDDPPVRVPPHRSWVLGSFGFTNSCHNKFSSEEGKGEGNGHRPRSFRVDGTQDRSTKGELPCDYRRLV